jgi:signal transduction histidine kinase
MRRQEFITLVSSTGALWPAVNSHFFRRLVRLLVVCMALAMLTPTLTSLAAAEPKTVVFLHSYGQNIKPWNEYSRALRQELERRSPWQLIIQEFSVITARSDEQDAETQLVEYLRALFAHRSPDLIVTFGAPGGAFVQRHRIELFPAIPMVLTTIEERRAQSLALTENDTVVAVRQKIPVLFSNILQLLPNTKTIAVVTGNSHNEQFWIGEVKRELELLKDRVTLRFYNDLSFDQILRETASLPPDSAIYWNQTRIEGGGAHEGERALRELAAVANAPIFTFDDTFLTGEIVGGPMTSVLAGTKAATDVVLRVLAGEKPAEIQTPPLEYGPAKYDWRQLQRWGISESRLPPGSEIQFREPTMWEMYRWQLAAGCALILLQGMLIAGLFHERRHRQLAEVQVGRRTAQLIHSNRFSVAGELTATIAHELNQPLQAVLTNAETAEVLLKSSAPDLHELREIVADIRRDDQRASEVLQRLRSILRRSPFKSSNFDLNEIANESIQLLSPLAKDRDVNLSGFTTPMPLPIRGDSVQLQQVILNLIVNAMDVMSKMPRAERRVIVSTRHADNFAEVSVSDTGPGIPLDRIKEVFEPFFTTKPQGMGIGLTIARTVVETHDGQIWAENQAGGGAVFHVRLPLAA